MSAKMTDILDLPEEVMEGFILPNLHWNDLLRCRRVCKVIKRITDDFIRLNHELAPEIEITEQSGKDLGSFMALGIPTTKLFIKNSTGRFYYDNLDPQVLTEFTTTYGPIIKSLRVEQVYLPPMFNERTFLSAFTNMKTFEAAYSVNAPYSLNFHLKEATKKAYEKLFHDLTKAGNRWFPESSKSLEVLKICRKNENETFHINGLLREMLLGNINIRHIAFPAYSARSSAIVFTIPDVVNPLADVMHAFLDVFKLVKEGNLRTIDFKNFYDDFDQGVDTMGHFISVNFLSGSDAEICYEHGAKLLNVPATWFLARKFNPEHGKPEFGIPVVSLVNLHPCVFSSDMTNLERIDIQKTSKASVNMNWSQDRPQWPALKSLEINVDSVVGEGDADLGRLFNFLFKDIERAQVEEISLKFERKDVGVPMAEDIVKSCPNLRKLRIVHWPGTNEELTKLWSGLPGLEEVVLENCEDLGNGAFVGEDAEDPAFLKLKNLKKLTLKGLDQMPQVTDTLFSRVLAHTQLSHLILTSEKPVENISKAAVSDLIGGKFAETIEKFPFDDWSMANVSAEEFKEIGRKFRSYNML